MHDDDSRSREELLQELHELRAALGATRQHQVSDNLVHQQNAAFYQMLLDLMSEGLAIQDTEGRVTFVNQAMRDMLGYTGEEVYGTLARNYVVEEDQPLFDARLGARRQGDRSRYELRWRHRNGGVVHALVSPAPIFDGAGNFRGAFAVFTDLTAFRSSEARFREILEHSRDIAYRFDLRTQRFDYVSPSVTTLLGYSQEETLELGTNGIRDTVHPDDLATLDNYLKHLRPGGHPEGPPHCEYRVRGKDGRYRWFSELASLVLDSNGNTEARVGALRDITETKSAALAIERAGRLEATATLAGGIAHEFNNLMTTVLANAELLHTLADANSEHGAMLESIQTAAEEGGQLAKQLLAFARGGRYELKPVDLNGVIEKAIEVESRAFPATIHVERKLAGEPVVVMADPLQMEQVLLNLSRNAVEAMENRGVLTIESGKKQLEQDGAAGLMAGAYGYLRVWDTGPGIAPESLARIFEPFYSTHFRGRGLGLPAVYGIVRNHGGKVEVHNRAEGGAVFTVYLPLGKPLENKPAPAKPTRDATETVLLVDDETQVRQATRQVLTRLGYTVHEAANGREALDFLQNHSGPIEVVLLDLAMPEMSGPEAFPHIRAMRPEAKVVIATGYENDPVARELLEGGAAGFVQKPFRMRTLNQVLRQALDET